MNPSAPFKEVYQESCPLEIMDIPQGSPEWHALRKTKITATDASIIMGASHWKTRIQLYHEKLSNDPHITPNARMQRGIDLEPVARGLFNLKTGYDTHPVVAVKGFTMASFDGMDSKMECIVEIKCPGEKDHSIALQGKIPDHYYPQVQHQIYVSGVQIAYYFSFDGKDGVIVEVKRDDDYIEKMLEEENKFYDCLMNKTPPEPCEGDYIERNDTLWERCASNYRDVSKKIKELQEQEEDLRKQLIFLSGESNTKGGGISLCHVQRKGNVEYSKIPELNGVNLDQYRKDSISTWRISCQ